MHAGSVGAVGVSEQEEQAALDLISASIGCARIKA
jgi:hypothetical protein